MLEGMKSAGTVMNEQMNELRGEDFTKYTVKDRKTISIKLRCLDLAKQGVSYLISINENIYFYKIMR